MDLKRHRYGRSQDIAEWMTPLSYAMHFGFVHKEANMSPLSTRHHSSRPRYYPTCAYTDYRGYSSGSSTCSVVVLVEVAGVEGLAGEEVEADSP